MDSVVMAQRALWSGRKVSKEGRGREGGRGGATDGKTDGRTEGGMGLALALSRRGTICQSTTLSAPK